MSQPKTELLDPNTLQKNPWNTNITTPENDAKLEESIKKFGFIRPILVREVEEGLQILGGEHRWEIAKKLGIDVLILNLGALDDPTAKQVSILDNTRYGTDDTLAFAELLKELSGYDDLQYLPYSDADFEEIFSTTHIALDDLGIEENFDNDEEIDNTPPEPKAPKTHTVMRFKVPILDAERITAKIAETRRDHDLNSADELTNAGDALVHLLVSRSAPVDVSDMEEALLADLDV
ncbi:ParB/RepB/Spo0J family partition protein [Phyllobacterium myrsinacearum]|uniref:ParB-like N-terminal domain-containing protein n=1 Tax=Phyllobacterium myrsinacearum TaxID=28101 RepID=A0A839EWM5_9HYPH|nr:ParB/RepB/Spo0J family partition protein [Phyllobacterium myrsinacearum]MBA8881706.1 hypothetical protein [Phyllobacterium myrsinacearum]